MFFTFCAENHPGITQKKWQQGISCLEMYFGGNNHGCQEYSKQIAFYTQADRLLAKLVAVRRSCRKKARLTLIIDDDILGLFRIRIQRRDAIINVRRTLTD